MRVRVRWKQSCDEPEHSEGYMITKFSYDISKARHEDHGKSTGEDIWDRHLSSSVQITQDYRQLATGKQITSLTYKCIGKA